jgi:hypothetical protein
VDNWAGAGIATVFGNESFNVFDHNFVVDITGNGPSIRADSRAGKNDFGFEGSGFWFAGPNNYFRNNVTADDTDYGITIFNKAGRVTVPSHPGADTSIAGQGTTIDMSATPLLQFDNNEVYGDTSSAMTLWFIGARFQSTVHNIGASVIKDFHVWHQSLYGVFGYPTNNVVFDHMVVRGDQNIAAHGGDLSQALFFSDYLTGNLVVQNADIQGEHYGIGISAKVGDTVDTGQTPITTTIKNSYFANYIDIMVGSMWATTGGKSAQSPRVTILDNDKFDHLSVPVPANAGSPMLAVMMNYGASQMNGNVIQSDTVLAYNYNQIAGLNYQIYYNEQAANFVVPLSVTPTASNGGLVGAPVAGLTNAQTWAQYGIAIAGAVAPTNATTRSDIYGLLRAF